MKYRLMLFAGERTGLLMAFWVRVDTTTEDGRPLVRCKIRGDDVEPYVAVMTLNEELVDLPTNTLRVVDVERL